MSKVRITVSRWAAEGGEPDVTTYDQMADGMWQSASAPTAPLCTLDELMYVEVDGALHVETVGASPSPWTLAAALPRGSEYLGPSAEVETGDELLDRYLYSGVIQVAINTQRWAAFPLRSGQPDAVIWLECDLAELNDYERAAPVARRTIGWASGIENESRTSGTFSWSLIEVDEGYLCFIADPDDDSNSYSVESRQGRTNAELAQAFLDWVDWDPVSCAVARAIELGGEFDGVASDLDKEFSDSCEVSAFVDLSQIE